MNPALILKAASIKDDLIYACRFRTLGNGQTDQLRLGLLGLGRLFALKIRINGRSLHKGTALRIIHDLGIDVVEAAEDGESGASGNADHLGPNPAMPGLP